MRSQVFRDFDAFAASVRDVDSRMMLRNPKHRRWHTSSVDLDGIDVQLARLGSGNIAQGELRPDGFLLYLPLTQGVEYSANGCTLVDGSFALFEPGCEFCISTKVAHDWCAVFVPNHLLAGGEELVMSPSRSCLATRPNPLAARRFQAMVSQIMTTAANHPDFESSPAAKLAGAEMLEVAAMVVGERKEVEPNRNGRPRIARQQIIRLSFELLEQSAGAQVGVGQLAAHANVSERTLRTAFKEYFGVGPVRYHQMRQLHLVHRTLRAADPDGVTVSSILMEHGEWAFSRFASRYRQLFGELPSETLRENAKS
jgi:AraC family ethanolamine operon transcriptional activator